MTIIICTAWRFLSTLSLRRATRRTLLLRRKRRHFYPRSPCGERPHAIFVPTKRAKFLSTLSLRRATGFHKINCQMMVISIHALLAESDGSMQSYQHAQSHFYPRSPCGERRAYFRVTSRPEEFLSTLSLRRATADCQHVVPYHKNFYPRSPCGERPVLY